MELKTSMGLLFPYEPEAIQILQGITPTDIPMTPEEEMIFVLRAYGQAVTGQHIQVDRVKTDRGRDTYIAYLQRNASRETLRNPNGRKKTAVDTFNRWLKENGFRIVVKPDPHFVPKGRGHGKNGKNGRPNSRRPPREDRNYHFNIVF